MATEVDDGQNANSEILPDEPFLPKVLCLEVFRLEVQVLGLEVPLVLDIVNWVPVRGLDSTDRTLIAFLRTSLLPSGFLLSETTELSCWSTGKSHGSGSLEYGVVYLLGSQSKFLHHERLPRIVHQILVVFRVVSPVVFVVMVAATERPCEFGESRLALTSPDQSCEHFIIKYSKLVKNLDVHGSAVELALPHNTNEASTRTSHPSSF